MRRARTTVGHGLGPDTADTTPTQRVAGDKTALLRHLAEAHEVIVRDPDEAVALHDLEHEHLDYDDAPLRWLEQHGHPLQARLLT
jgi:hypothetical protein